MQAFPEWCHRGQRHLSSPLPLLIVFRRLQMVRKVKGSVCGFFFYQEAENLCYFVWEAANRGLNGPFSWRSAELCFINNERQHSSVESEKGKWVQFAIQTRCISTSARDEYPSIFFSTIYREREGSVFSLILHLSQVTWIETSSSLQLVK